MFSVKTTIVLGAGASCGYNYPLGHQLVDRMISICSDWASNGRRGGALAQQAEKLLKLLEHYDPISIDAFLHHYSNDDALTGCAKRVIASILLSVPDPILFKRRAANDQFHWYRLLWDAIVNGQTAKELADPRIPLEFNIITFNYDPSLEYFLFSRVTHEGSMFSADQQVTFLEKLRGVIAHVYGCIMNYKWCGGDDDDRYYGGFDEGAFNRLEQKGAKNIRLIGERAGSYDSMKESIKRAEQVIFLGFAFDETNIGPKVLDLKNSLAQRHIGNRTNVIPTLKYTNLGDSAQINRKIESLMRHHFIQTFPRWEDKVIKSTKKVYYALAEDFSLTGLH